MKGLLSIALATVVLTNISPAAQVKRATPSEETRMTGRLAAAIEDVGGGYTREGLSRFVWINNELKKREYSLWTRWNAHRWYAQAMLDSGKSQEALDVLQNAEQEACLMTDEKQQKTAKEETAKLVREARQHSPKK